MIDAVRLALIALRTQARPQADDLNTVTLDGRSDARVALDRHGRPHLLLVLGSDEPTQEPPRSPVATLELDLRTLDLGGRRERTLDVACLFEAVAEVFEHFVVAVIEQLNAQEESPISAVVKVLEKWRRFLEPGPSGPSREKLSSIFGELVVLLDIVTQDPARRLDAWSGPFGGRHDFRRANAALEVKTTRSHTSRSVTINGEDQLDEPDGGQLHLQLIRVEEAPGAGRSVATAVDELLALGVSAEALFDALTANGLPVVDLAASAELCFVVRERRTFVVDERMPRIIPATFASGERPTGVASLTYDVDLDHALDCEVSEADYTAVVRRLAEGVSDA